MGQVNSPGAGEIIDDALLRDLYRDSMASSLSSFPSSSSNSSTSQWKYDVFLSFRGEDTRNTATDFLNYALERRGIYTFKDDEKLEKGKSIKPELLKAIEESRFAVVIFSKNYASSTWCLEELVKIVDCKKEKGMTVVPIFYNVDPSDVRKQMGTFTQAFVEHEKQLKEKVGTWRAALSHVANIAGYHVNNSSLLEAVESIVRLILHKSSFEFSEITEGLVGIDSQLVELGRCLALWLEDDVRFIGIWAMGGMGKSTLASVAYKMISKEFEACCFIDDVRKKGLFSLQKDLISQILNETILIKNKYDGVHMIKKMLQHKKILLVLDDVDESNELKMLVKQSDWFGLGSRIIITTRDKHLLKEFPVDEIFEVKALNYEDALCLFCSKAFKKETGPDEYLKLSKSFLQYVNCLPLALEVLGSFLFGRSIAEWKNALEMLKEDPKPEINQVLKISFDGLPNSVKDIFKDIACLFNHEEKDHVVQMLDSLGRHSHIGLRILIDKSLLKISKNNKLWMHNLIEDMGRNIVRQESLEPGERSRLWLYKDIDHVLKNNTGTAKVQAIDIKGAKDTSIYHEEKEACWRPQGLAPLVTPQWWVLSALSWQGLALLVTLWGWVQRTLSWQGFTSSKKPVGLLYNPNAFLKMPNLKFLRIHSISLQLDTLPLPNNLSYFECNDYSLKSLHSLPAGLVELRLPLSKIQLLWGGMKIFENLKSINMDGSSDLIISPNFNGVQNLEELVLARCSNLRKLHPSIGKLKKLKILDLKGCQELTSLPDKFEMESLVTLNLTHCLKVKKIPEFVGNMELLQELLLEGTAIIELPSSVECLTGLKTLILHNCKNLVCLPNTICSLTSLNNLDLFRCSKFDKLPEDLGNIVSLKKLHLSETAIKELPSSFEFLTGLTVLYLTDCKNFVLLPSTICSLKSLDTIILFGCPKFDKLPKDLGNIINLKELNLSGTAIKELPSSVEFLIGLTSLDLTNCKKFVLLPSTICSLKSLEVISLFGCSKFDKLPKDLGNIVSLKMLYLNETAIKELPSSIEFLIGLATLDLKDCKKFVLLPSTVCSLKSLERMYLSRCPKFVNLPENFGNLKHLKVLGLEGTAIEVLPSSVGRLAALESLNLKDCKNLVCLPSSICNLKRVKYLNLTGCSKIDNLPENLGNMTSLMGLLLGGTAIKELPSSTIHLKQVQRVSFKGCQLSSSSLTSMPRNRNIDLSDCNLSAIPSGIDRFSIMEPFDLFLRGNDFVSLSESISQFSGLTRLYLDGCKSLRSLSNIPSKVYFICVDNCTSLERLPEPPNDFYWSSYNKFTVQCFNCFKLAYNNQNFSNMFQGQEFIKCYIIPGREIPKWFEKVNICDTSVGPCYKTKKVKIQLPGSRSGCDEWRGIVLCVVFLPSERHHRYQQNHHIRVNGCQMRCFDFEPYPDTWLNFTSEYGKVESHHLWLQSVSKNNFRLPKTLGRSIDKKGFHQVELEIQTRGLEVEKIGFRVVYKQDIEDPNQNK
ncbi:hypothetical protein SO802_034360 [Lithocarpus litseifolius]|uniref:TIR domain-containing protein n=1 Tax=Lithocarpus litseifolius TaxID=425828 RepID=A0AAW2BIZ1_9ROSI